jgi:hypothetical protein
MKKMVSKTLIACAVTAALGAFSSGAMAQTTFPNFTVTETSVPGSNALVLPNLDKITGNYTEVITFSGTNAFNVSLLWNAGQFVSNDGTTPVASQLSPTGGTANQYGMYALYTGSGTFTTTGGRTTFNFASGGEFNLYLDPQSNTTFIQAPNGSTSWGRTNAGEDLLIATGLPFAGQGTLDPSLSTCGSGTSGGSGINCGSFGATSTFGLTAVGSTYFTSPSPFYNVTFQSGQFNNFPTTGTQLVNGSLDVVFAVPEPASVALIGLGLMGLGLSRRRSKKA